MRHQGVSDLEFADFYAASKDRCYRALLASGMSRHEADDALAEAFARAFATWRKTRECQSPAAWVVRTAMNANISRWRKQRREAPASAEDDRAALPQPSADLDLRASIAQLPHRQREVVILRYYFDLDTLHTSTALGIAPGTVTATLYKALRSLRSQLKSEEAHS